MQLVELIRGIATRDDTYDAAKKFVAKLGKTATMSEDFPAFIVNRILLPMINEAIYTLYEGVGSVESIDTAMRLGANHPMGPLQLADFIGLDTCLSVMQVLHEGLADSKYRPCPLLVKYVEAGWLGRKTQRGFYDYRGDVPVPTRVSRRRRAAASPSPGRRDRTPRSELRQRHLDGRAEHGDGREHRQHRPVGAQPQRHGDLVGRDRTTAAPRGSGIGGDFAPAAPPIAASPRQGDLTAQPLQQMRAPRREIDDARAQAARMQTWRESR